MRLFDRSKWEDLQPVLGAMLVVAGIAAWIALRGAAAPNDAPELRGMRLEMTDDEARGFDGADAGTWAAASDGSQLVWTPLSERPDLPASVTLDLHSRFVVAIRADLHPEDPLARGPALEASFSAIVSRAPTEDGLVRWTLLARQCSDHAQEVASLLATTPCSGTDP